MTVHVVGPVPVTSSSTPHRSAGDLRPVGFVEEEYFLEGRADAVDPDGAVLEADAPYTTRMLVRRPANPARFSGTVHLEPCHNLAEATPTWSVAQAYLTRYGHAWVGVTVSAGTFGPPGSRLAGGVRLLRSFDPDRYERLRLLASDAPPPRTSPPGAGGYDVQAMRWRLALATAQGAGIVSDLVALLRANHEASPLAGLGVAVSRLYASGWSQTGLFWASFLDRGCHEQARAAFGVAPDGYLVAVAPGPAHRPADAVVVNLLSEAEVVGTLEEPVAVADDTDTPPFRGYEVPGTFHLWHLGFGGPFDRDEHGAHHNDRSWPLLVHALLANLGSWSHDGIPMPRAPRITRDPSAPDGIARDEHGNARGGLRTSWVEVPSAQYLPRCSCSPTVGEMRPFDRARLDALYGSGARRAEAWASAVDAMVHERWLLPEDAAALRAAPE